MLTRDCQLLDPDGIIDKKEKSCRYCHKNKKTLIRTDSTYKETILSKAETFNLFVSNCIISGSAFLSKTGTQTGDSAGEKGQFIFFLKDIKMASEIKYGKGSALEILVDEPIITEDSYEMNSVRIVIPNLENGSEIAKIILTARDEFLEDLRVEREKYGFKMTSDASSKFQLEAQQKAFFDDQYTSHLNDPNFPILVFDEDKSKKQVCVMYIDENKNINFLAINGTEFQSVHGFISYKNICFMDKPSAITFKSPRDESTYGGSFVTMGSETLSEMLKGILFESMHMKEGIMEGYESPDNYVLDLKDTPSDVEYAVMQYYSDIMERYINIDITEEMYEFLVKNLGAKPYNLENQVEIIIQESISSKLKSLYKKGYLTDNQLEEELKSI